MQRKLHGVRRGAAAGHVRILLDDEGCSDLLLHAAQLFAAGRVPAKVVDGLRLGRLVALQKLNGSIRALVMGDDWFLGPWDNKPLLRLWMGVAHSNTRLPLELGPRHSHTLGRFRAS